MMLFLSLGTTLSLWDIKEHMSTVESGPFGTADRDNKKESMGQERLSISRQRLSSARVLMGNGGTGKSVKERGEKNGQGEWEHSMEEGWRA